MAKMWEQLSEVHPIQFRELKACLGVKELEFVDAPLWWHEKGLSYTASGYGEKIPTRRKVKAWAVTIACIVGYFPILGLATLSHVVKSI